MAAFDAQAEERALAWVGDAVLSLWARQWILRQVGRIEGEVLEMVTSNQFLSRFGRPTAVEAGIGRIYRAEGIEAAAQWLDANIEPAVIREVRRRRPDLAGRLPAAGTPPPVGRKPPPGG